MFQSLITLCEKEMLFPLKTATLIISVLWISFTFTQTVDDRIESYLTQMTLEEKILQLHKEGGFNTADNTRLNIPGFIMADGPHGVRDGMATCFPVGIAMAATWDPELVYRIGIAMGKEFRGKGKNQALGPCMDLCRDPRNGRSPESGGEDPFLCAQITSALISGIQSTPCIATAKHFNCVNKQINRLNNNVIITQRLLIEHYGLNFRTAVQKGGTMSVMNAYNLINGEKCAQNFNLLTTILRDNWGFPYYVVSDWGSIWNSQAAITAGCDICMGSDHYQNDLLNLIQNGSVPVSVIDEAVRRVLKTKFLSGMLDYYPAGTAGDVNSHAHQQLSLEAARKCVVLLKNQDNILPLNKDSIDRVAIIGPSADVAQLDGSGSSYVTPFYSVSPKMGIEAKIGLNKILHTRGCDINSPDTSGFALARTVAAAADVVIYFGGLDTSQEGEGFDRAGSSVNLPGRQSDLINQLAGVNENIIVVLESGGICGVHNFIDNIKGLIYAFYPGQEGGNALADVLFGDYNPGGKLPVTMPVADSQLPDWNQDFTDDYGCGYRWYDEMNLQPEFSFGYGLSYTTFSYSNLHVSPASFPAGETVEVNVDVTNTGSRPGEEVVQVYLSDDASSVYMPRKQLKGFKRISLSPAETQTVTFALTPEHMYYFDEATDRFRVEPGSFTVRVGGSSDNLPLSGSFTVSAAPEKPDLIITHVRWVPRYPVEGDSVIFLARVINEGTGPSPAGVIHNVSFRINGQLYSRSTDFDQSIPAGGSALLAANTGENGIPTWPAVTGNYRVEALVDEQNIIPECREDNNRLSDTMTVITRPPLNLALHKPVTTSSVENTGLEGDKAVDGFYGTRWSSQFSDPQFIYVNLGGEYDIGKVILHWETAYGKTYLIQTSLDSLNWTAVGGVASGNGGIDVIPVSARARFVRMYGLKRGTEWGYSLYEFEVYPPSDSTSSIPGRESVPNYPEEFNLNNNFPNPFNPSTTITFELPRTSVVSLKIFNILGEKVATLLSGQMPAGTHEIRWTTSNLASGVYLFRLDAVNPSDNSRQWFSKTRKMLLVR
jgi:beta-glucosidase